MAKKNELIQFAGQFQSVVEKISRRLEAKETNVVEVIIYLAQSDAEAEFDGIVDAMAAVIPFQFTDKELTIQIPALPRPTLAELQAKFPGLGIKSIERDTSPVEAVTLKLATVLRTNEESVGGANYERRIAPKLDIILGFQQAMWLVGHQDEFPAFMALLGKIYIDFSGLVVVTDDDDRHFPYLSQDGTHWRMGWYWIRLGFSRLGRIAVSSK